MPSSTTNSTQSQNHPWLTGCSCYNINLDKIGKCPLSSSGCSLSCAPCAPWSAVAGLALLPLQQRSIWNAWLRQVRVRAVARIPLTPLKRRHVSAPLWRGWNHRTPHNAQRRDGWRERDEGHWQHLTIQVHELTMNYVYAVIIMNYPLSRIMQSE